MKYIRTKDGIFDETQHRHTKIKGRVSIMGIFYDFKESDTIEELCDELIIKNPNNDGDFYRKVFVFEDAWENILNERHAQHCTNRDIYEHDVEIFGAIWIYNSNGVPTLKAVAKMNEKGELELL